MAHDGMVKVKLFNADGDVETLWATPLGDDLYRLENSPWYASASPGRTSLRRAHKSQVVFPSFSGFLRSPGIVRCESS
jgi:hypothetical protein